MATHKIPTDGDNYRGSPIPITRKRTARALVDACPRPYDRTLDAMLRLGLSTGTVWAGADTIARVAKLSRAAVLRHRSWLAERGYVVKMGGGYRGRTAIYRIPALEGKSLIGSQSETLSTLERVSFCDPNPVVTADVVRAVTTTHARAANDGPRPPAGKSHFLPGTGWV